ncbi:uncharacterized protein [Ptychodera flava]|uniref:uncharacterized protein n=1 Tax=Ptychodera flava TaxID=63121 RepID=UPI00396AAD55
MKTLCLYSLFVALLAGEYILADDSEKDDLSDIVSQLRQRLDDHFSENRHHDVNLANKDDVRKYIADTLRSFNLQVHYNHFSGLYNSYSGINIIGMIPGERVGTTDDQVILLGAHYDTTNNTFGVDDNGSGVAVLLEAAAMVTKQICKSKNTILFVAFDLEENQNTGCNDFHDICIGSYHFVNDWLEPVLKINQTTRSQFQGAMVMETVLNYNKIDNSQQFPEEIIQHFPDVARNIISRNYRGDFLTVIGRQTDAVFSAKFVQHLGMIDVPDTHTEVFELPIQGVPTQEQARAFGDFFRSDHTRFWFKGPPYLPALFITDTANFRKPMTDCYHKPCDNKGMITNDNLLFLARTTKAAVNMLIELGSENSTRCSVGGASSPHQYGVTFSVAVSALIGVISGWICVH